MKPILFLLTAMFCSGITYAQDALDCRVWYNYDAAGQRVKRYYECKDKSLEPEMHPIKLTVFPNPTEGPVIVVTDVPVDELAAAIYTIDGMIVTSDNCTDCSMLSLSIASQLTGSYVMQVTATKQDYPDLQKGFTLIKNSD